MLPTFTLRYVRLPAHFYERFVPVPVASPQLVAFNRPLAEELGFDLDAYDAALATQVFSGNRVPDGAEPLAMAYAGHQFGNFVPRLGDGRAVLLGEVTDRQGRLRDIQLKGGGRTPFSRGGDGRAPLGPVLREYLVSEAMHAMAIPTTRALAAVTTGERVVRRIPEPGAVLTRVAASHIRVGTFQYFAGRGDIDGLRALADHVIERHYPQLQPELADTEHLNRPEGERYLALLEAVQARQAALIARWMGVGFIHGVMNTDNMSVSGETLDFGPCAFMEAYDPRTVFSSIDEGGRYAYGNQPGIGQWNLARLAETLLPLIDADQEQAIARATQVIETYPGRFEAEKLAVMRAKLGLRSAAEQPFGKLGFAASFTKADGVTPLSPWHDLPLLPEGKSSLSGGVVNFMCEIPRGATAKLEVQKGIAHNPIMQDTKKGKLRYYTYGASFFNYGMLPQTWEDPAKKGYNGTSGDNDPLDVMEIGSRPFKMGEMRAVKVLGDLELIDQGELDHKIIEATES